jgi:hypothetical protein
MTDRMKGCWVSFDHDIRSDDVEQLVNAIQQLRGVAGVELHVSDHTDWMARTQVREEIRNDILELYKKLGRA